MNTVVTALLVGFTSILCANHALCQGGGDARPDALGDIADRLVGDDAPVGRFPYICSLRKRGSRKHVCGATLVNPLWVLTAAHCVDPSTAESAGLVPVVYCGIHDVNEQNSDLIFNGIGTVMHFSWSGVTREGYDIAMIQLDRRAQLTVPVLNVLGNLPEPNELLAALGWGETPTNSNPDKLQLSTRLPFITYRTCSSFWEEVVIPSDIVLCAGIGERDTCRGDSGGPLLKIDAPGGVVADGAAGLDLLLGVTSFGASSCGAGTRPGVYTHVGYFQEWILEVIEGRSGPPSAPAGPSSSDPSPRAPPTLEVVKDVVAAIRDDDADTVRAALESGVDPSSRYNDISVSHGGNDPTLLHWTARFGAPKSAQVLIESGVDVDPKSSISNTPLHYTGFYRTIEVAEVLLGNGANIEAGGFSGYTPLHFAASIGGSKTVEFFLSKGAEIDSLDADNNTPLMLASLDGHSEVVEVLVYNGASKGNKNIAGETALDVICESEVADCSEEKRTMLEELLGAG